MSNYGALEGFPVATWHLLKLKLVYSGCCRQTMFTDDTDILKQLTGDVIRQTNVDN